MTAAIFGLIGVVVGALVTAGVDAWREHRREKRALQAAMRVLRNDLQIAQAMLSGTNMSGIWWRRPQFELPVDAYDQHRDLLAAEIEVEKDWLEVSDAFRELDDLNRYRAALDDSAGGPGKDKYTPGRDQRQILAVRHKAGEAVAVLDRLLS